MPISRSSEQILALAPDAGSARAAQSLAGARSWMALGCDQRAAWGECKGSAKDPYRTQVDLAEPAFRCSCPSRKFPCKHGLGLLLLLAHDPGAFEQAAPPAWVAEWLARRDQHAAARPAQPAPPISAAPAAEAPLAAPPSRTAAAREAKVAAGTAELGRWLRDLLRRGLAEAQSQPPGFWNSMAARLVDAQAPGLARMVRELGTLPATGAGWQSRMLERIACLHLLADSYARIETLAPAAQADLRTAIGWSQASGALRAAGPEQALLRRDRWLVLGRRVEEDEQLRTQRTWLWGEACACPALLLSFAMFSQPLDRSVLPGSVIDAELAFFPSAYPLRAVVREYFAPPAALTSLPGAPDCHAATGVYAAALAQQPWLERFPLALAAVTPELAGEHWRVRDQAGHMLPLVPRFERGWQLLALSGGRPLALFGEWDGMALLPLSALAEGEFWML